ncbi:MAG: hypothetical protein COW88_03145 [Candidatus Lloydbacteria bacterium CG22_combo_CG10-13_8_21_14_all_47_15]|uniref:Uncharacterized protein n=1 Tax=Candidatus Lloydbacteria bacterium CG22_combo_CG10-13_8_21_14_all_47_15 TaxID=1974635 RepID=A0A2H0CT95_9BACT|nr:MAG: hypothetical protein COW88_03145 [Candidatus Lloydbacteria bacterium CG22_combo_CG10-13_8_21_14_all_47_15]
MFSFGISVSGIAGIFIVRALQMRRQNIEYRDESTELNGESMTTTVSDGIHGVVTLVRTIVRILHKRHTEPLIVRAKGHAKIKIVRGIDIIHRFSAKAKHALEGKRDISLSGDIKRSPFFEEMSGHQMTGEQRKKIVRTHHAKKKAQPELLADAPIPGIMDPRERIEKTLSRRRKKSEEEGMS